MLSSNAVPGLKPAPLPLRGGVQWQRGAAGFAVLLTIASMSLSQVNGVTLLAKRVLPQCNNI